MSVTGGAEEGEGGAGSGVGGAEDLKKKKMDCARRMVFKI